MEAADHDPRRPSLQYGIETENLPAQLRGRAVTLASDDATEAFIATAYARPPAGPTMVLYRWLRRYLSDYDAYGLLGLYPLFLLSTDHYRALLGAHARGSLLDVGAGSGAITEQARPLFSHITVTETSSVMRRRLRRRGFDVASAELDRNPWSGQGRFDVVSALNVLDRTARPRTLLRQLIGELSPDGRLLLSIPLPLRPPVDLGRETVDPDEPLPACEGPFEAALGPLVADLLEPAGLRVECLSRAPYLSAGSRDAPLVVLDAALVVCAHAA